MSNMIKIQNSNKTIGGDGVFVIAEIGKNFIQTKEEKSVEEYLENAKRLIDAAIESGADVVKFQTHEVEDEQLNIDITSPHFAGSDRYSWLTRNTLATPISFWQELKKYCDKKGIIFFSTPMSRKAAQKLEQVGVPMWKVGSGDVQDYVTLNYMIRTGKPIIISSGMVSLAELEEVVKYITSKGSPLVVLYCISQYPAPKEYFNLSTIPELIKKYPDVVIGFSDHSIGYDVSLAAVNLGARVLEKHFSHSRELWGADHKVSMTPQEFKEMVMAIRSGAYKQVDPTLWLGTRGKEMEGAGNKFRPYFNKSLMAACDIPAGTLVTEDMVYAMRPRMYSKGLPANELDKVLGKSANVAIKKFDPLNLDVLV